MNQAPSTLFEAVMQNGETGLAATLRLGIIDNDGATTVAKTNAGITEVAFGVYSGERTSPADGGQYTLVWDDGTDNGVIAIEDLFVGFSLESLPGSAEYVTAAELKEILQLQGETFADLAIDIAISSASRTCDAYKKKVGTGFYSSAGTRYYSPEAYDTAVAVNDLISVTSVTVDSAADGSYSDTWVSETDFWLEPANAAANGRPYNKLVLRQQAGRSFTGYPRSVKITGSFGWATTPVQVKEATILLANDLLYRMREAPLGVLIAAGGEAVAMARLGRINGAAAMLLDLVDAKPETRSVQLR